MKHDRFFYIIEFIIISIFYISCLNNKNGFNREKQINIFATDIKSIIYNDTSHYKILIFFNPNCGVCHKHFNVFYKNAFLKFKDDVIFFFIADQKYTSKYNESIFIENGMDIDKFYCIVDTNWLFYEKNEKRFTNLINFLFPSEKYVESYGIPISLIINKNNTLKIQKCKYKNDSIVRYRPFPIHDLINYDISKIDFSLIEDTIICLDYEYPYK